MEKSKSLEEVVNAEVLNRKMKQLENFSTVFSKGFVLSGLKPYKNKEIP